MASIPPFLAGLGDPETPFTVPVVAGYADAELLEGQRQLAELRRRVETVAAAFAGEIAHRSRRELGRTGLAATEGVRSAEELIAKVTAGSRRDAHTLVKAAEIIRTRLGQATGVPEEALHEAAVALIDAAPELTVENLVTRAARVRDELDLAGIAERENALRDKRFLRITRQPDGMTRVSGLLDPESAAIIVPVLDAATSPRRGGPRFVSPDAQQRAEDLMRDERTTEQLTLDVFVELVRAGSRVDDGKLLGDRKPAVRILVTKTDLESPKRPEGTREGAAFFEGQADAVSIATAERFICSSGAVPILFDTGGRVLNLGREQRLFSEKQRIVMAARDGGCLMCGAPPSWCEAHHIDHRDEHHGRTDVDDGVLLCRFCHLTIHNNRWRVRRHGGDYRLERPDTDRIPHSIPLPSRSPARDRLHRDIA